VASAVIVIPMSVSLRRAPPGWRCLSAGCALDRARGDVLPAPTVCVGSCGPRSRFTASGRLLALTCTLGGGPVSCCSTYYPIQRSAVPQGSGTETTVGFLTALRCLADLGAGAVPSLDGGVP